MYRDLFGKCQKIVQKADNFFIFTLISLKTGFPFWAGDRRLQPVAMELKQLMSPVDQWPTRVFLFDALSIFISYPQNDRKRIRHETATIKYVLLLYLSHRPDSVNNQRRESMQLVLVKTCRPWILFKYWNGLEAKFESPADIDFERSFLQSFIRGL